MTSIGATTPFCGSVGGMTVGSPNGENVGGRVVGKGEGSGIDGS